MTDIMNSPAVKQVMKQPGHVSADGAAQAQGSSRGPPRPGGGARSRSAQRWYARRNSRVTLNPTRAPASTPRAR